jgi:hypothetical protein
LKRYLIAILFLIACCTIAQGQQQEQPASSKQRLTKLMTAVGVRVEEQSLLDTTQTYQELRLHLTGSAKTGLSAEELRSQQLAVTLLGTDKRTGALARQRSFELASDHLLLVTVTRDTRLRWFSLVPDPRILRAERPGPNGQLTGEVIFQPNLDYTFNIPDDNESTELRLYHPRWNGQEFALVLLGTIPLKKN